MPYDIIPRSFFDLPNMRLMSMWDDDENLVSGAGNPGGLSISEDNAFVYVEAAVPGVKPSDIEMTYHNGVLKIYGKKIDEEKKDRKNYRMMTNEFSYQVAIREIDANEEPEAKCENGVLHVKFTKSKAAQPKKISVR